jgi:hypothetical protein
LGEVAYQLETLAANGKVTACSELHRSFVSSLTRFIERVIPLFESGSDAGKRKEAGADAVVKILPDLDRACEYFDSALALESLDPLTAMDFGEEVNNLVADIANAFERFDFDSAHILIERLKGALGV